MDSSSDLLSTGDAAALLEISVRRLRQLTARLGALRGEDGWLWPREAVERERAERLEAARQEHARLSALLDEQGPEQV